MRQLILFLALLLSSQFASAAPKLENIDAAVDLTNQVMKKISSGDLQGGFELVKSYSVVPTAEIDAALGQAQMQQPVIAARFGKSIGYELIRNDSVGGSLAQIVYLQKFEKHATVWRFILYRGSDGWTINTFKYVDDLTAAF